MDAILLALKLLISIGDLGSVPPPQPAEQRQVDEKAEQAQSLSPRD